MNTPTHPTPIPFPERPESKNRNREWGHFRCDDCQPDMVIEQDRLEFACGAPCKACDALELALFRRTRSRAEMVKADNELHRFDIGDYSPEYVDQLQRKPFTHKRSQRETGAMLFWSLVGASAALVFGVIGYGAWVVAKSLVLALERGTW